MVKTKVSHTMALSMLRRLNEEFSYSNGDFSHKPTCAYIHTESLRDCDCGLMALVADIKWLVGQGASDGT